MVAAAAPRRPGRTLRHPRAAGAVRGLRHLAVAFADLDSVRDDAGLRRERRRLLRVRPLPIPAGAAADAVCGGRDRRGARRSSAGAVAGSAGGCGRRRDGRLLQLADAVAGADARGHRNQRRHRPPVGGTARRGARPLPPRDCVRSRVPARLQQPRHDAAREGPAPRGDRRLSAGAARASRLPGRAVQPRQCAVAGRQAGRSDRSLPRRAPDHPGVGRRPQQPGDRADESGAGWTKRRRSSARRWSSTPIRCSRISIWATRWERRGTTTTPFRQFRRASQLNPTDASIHYDLGSLLVEADRLDQAIAEFRAALHASIRGRRRRSTTSGSRSGRRDGWTKRSISSGRRSRCSPTSRTRSTTSRSRCKVKGK